MPRHLLNLNCSVLYSLHSLLNFWDLTYGWDSFLRSQFYKICEWYILYMYYICLYIIESFVCLVVYLCIKRMKYKKKSVILLFNVREPSAWFLLSLWQSPACLSTVLQPASLALSMAASGFFFLSLLALTCEAATGFYFHLRAHHQHDLSPSARHQHDLSIRSISSALTLRDMPRHLLNLNCSVFYSLYSLLIFWDLTYGWDYFYDPSEIRTFSLLIYKVVILLHMHVCYLTLVSQ